MKVRPSSGVHDLAKPVIPVGCCVVCWLAGARDAPSPARSCSSSVHCYFFFFIFLPFLIHFAGFMLRH